MLIPLPSSDTGARGMRGDHNDASRTVSSRLWRLWRAGRLLSAIPDCAASVLHPAVRDPLDHRPHVRATRRQPTRAARLALGAGHVPARLAFSAGVPDRARRRIAWRHELALAATCSAEPDLATTYHS